MRNLKLQHRRCSQTNLKAGKFLVFNPAACADDDPKFFIATSDALYAYHDAGRQHKLIDLPGIVGVEYISLDNEICLATSPGEVLLFSPKTAELREGPLCDEGIQSMAWAPTQETVAFITTCQNVTFMSCTLDTLAVHHLNDDCDHRAQFVNVGWGKRETQFHGLAGKQAAKHSEVALNKNTSDLPKEVTHAWRGDGKFFVVSFVSEIFGRMFKVFSRQGQLLHISERAIGLQSAIAWRPSGNWIAVPQLQCGESTVALFEKNGLLRMNIELPFDLTQELITAISWSADSHVLALLTELRVPRISYRLYFYTVSNYHWYLKHLLAFSAADAPVAFNWDDRLNAGKNLRVLLANGILNEYQWQFDVDVYRPGEIVAVIDGQRLLLTNFSRSIVPPPMSNYSIALAEHANECCFWQSSGDIIRLCVYCASSALVVYEAQHRSKSEEFVLRGSLQPSPDLSDCCLTNLTLLNEETLVGTSSKFGTTDVLLIRLNFPLQEYHKIASINLAGTVNQVALGVANGCTLYAHIIETQHVVALNVADDYTKLECSGSHLKLPQQAERLKCFLSNDSSTDVIVSLGNKRWLQVDEEVVSKDVTSFDFVGDYLYFTKIDSLHFFHKVNMCEVQKYALEPGSRIVSASGSTARAIFQHPRGNLEAIHPRILIIDLVGQLLEQNRYNDAMKLMRKMRLNLNFICDYNMAQFIENIGTFITSLEEPFWLLNFINDLANTDSTLEMGTKSLNRPQQFHPAGYSVDGKIGFVCQALLDRLSEINDHRYFQAMIIANAKMGRFEDALQLIWREKQEQKQRAQSGNVLCSPELFKNLLAYINNIEIYNVALGTYDLSLTSFVAEQSQMDPREYLPYLNELKSYEPSYRKYKIDVKLKRYEQALLHAAQCADERHEEFMQLIEKHVLYKCAIRHFKSQSGFYQQLCLAFANYLRVKGRFDNASLMYERAGQLEQALMSARHVLDWQRAMVLARQCNKDTRSLAMSLAILLQERNRNQEAFTLLKTYTGDMTMALQALIKGAHFLDALYEASQNVNSSLDTLIYPALVAYGESLQNSLTTQREQFEDYKQRFFKVHDHKKSLEQTFIDPNDIMSDTTSLRSSRYTVNSTCSSNKTFRSSKNRRKHERKLLSLKPGNPFEDIALIDALHTHICKVLEQQQHVRDTCKALAIIKKDEIAIGLQYNYRSFLEIIRDSLDVIWTPEVTGESGQLGLQRGYDEIQLEQHFALLDKQKRLKPVLRIIDWELEIFG